MYQFSVSEGAAVGTSVGRVIATDADMGENTDMSYLIKDQEGGELFKVTTDGDTQEAVITIKKVGLGSRLLKTQRIFPSTCMDILTPSPELTPSPLSSVVQPLDFESKRTHNVVVEAVNKHVDPRFVDLGSFRDQTIVRVSVSDTDEPPIFQPPEGTILEVQEDVKLGAVVGIITAKDPDMENAPVR